jgi:V/A-type H+-transporting ATPase subunit G/H
LSSLQEALAVLLGAESEGTREVQEARSEAEALVKNMQEKMAKESEKRLEAAREKASTVLENARAAADEEARSITELGKSERERTERRFREVAGDVVDALIQESVEQLLGRGGKKA